MIRRARVDDAEACRQVVEAAYTPYIERLAGVRPPPMDADYAAAVRDDETWVADDGGHVVGVLVLQPEPDAMLLANIAVRPDLQRSGLGRHLLALAEERALAAGKSVVRLYTNLVMVENQRIYEHLGYVETGREELEIGETTPAPIVRIFYEKTLPDRPAGTA